MNGSAASGLMVIEGTETAPRLPVTGLINDAPPVRFSSTKPRWPDPVLVPRGSSRAQWRNAATAR
jgi:hypothetical protein